MSFETSITNGIQTPGSIDWTHPSNRPTFNSHISSDPHNLPATSLSNHTTLNNNNNKSASKTSPSHNNSLNQSTPTNNPSNNSHHASSSLPTHTHHQNYNNLSSSGFQSQNNSRDPLRNLPGRMSNSQQFQPTNSSYSIGSFGHNGQYQAGPATATVTNLSHPTNQNNTHNFGSSTFSGDSTLNLTNLHLNNDNVRDNEWLKIEVCRDHLRGNCKREPSVCKFGHPPLDQPGGRPRAYEGGKVICCFDNLKNKCRRDNCKYFHPPLHLKAQIEINGKQNLILKNEIMNNPNHNSNYLMTKAPAGIDFTNSNNNHNRSLYNSGGYNNRNDSRNGNFNYNQNQSNIGYNPNHQNNLGRGHMSNNSGNNNNNNNHSSNWGSNSRTSGNYQSRDGRFSNNGPNGTHSSNRPYDSYKSGSGYDSTNSSMNNNNNSFDNRYSNKYHNNNNNYDRNSKYSNSSSYSKHNSYQNKSNMFSNLNHGLRFFMLKLLSFN